MDMPTTSNVLQFFTEDGTKISVRPSGTEPKIKFYVEVKGKMENGAEYDKAIADADAKIALIKKDLGI
jgi:phosphoglucomutase